MGDTEDIQVRQDMAEVHISLSSAGETVEEQEKTASEAGQKNYQEETRKNYMKRVRSSWPAFLIGVLMGVLMLSLFLVIQMHTQQSLTAELKHMAEELQIKKSHLKQLLNSTHHNFTSLSAEKTKLSLLLKNISQENAQLSLDLKNTLQEKTHLEVKNRALATSLNSALNNFSLLSAEKTELNLLLVNTSKEKTELSLLLEDTQRNISLEFAERERWRQLLDLEQQTTMQLGELNKRQRSILFTSKLSFLWRLCDKNTLQCSRCLPGWVEHDSRCFFLSKDPKKWEMARRDCLDMGADMAVVLKAEDQAFLTNMTFQFVQQHPEEWFHSAWIGLQDMTMEGEFFWVTGQMIHPEVTYWRSGEPNNVMASWDSSQAGQDCVAIVPPTNTEKEGWLNSWDDIMCVGLRHYMCETTALIVT